MSRSKRRRRRYARWLQVDRKARLVLELPKIYLSKKTSKTKVQRQPPPQQASFDAVVGVRQGALSEPKERRDDEPTRVGNLLDATPSYVWTCKYEGLLVSQNHWRLPSGAWSGGGPFYTFMRSQRHEGEFTGTFYRNGTLCVNRMKGVLTGPITRWTAAVPDFVKPSDAMAACSNYYAQGYAKARPGNPIASAGQFIAELRDLPGIPLKGVYKGYRSLFKSAGTHFADIPEVLQARHKSFLNLGSEYLNVEFGWKPFVRDLRQMFNLWKTIDKKMGQIARENGQNINRRAQVANDTHSSGTTTNYSNPLQNVCGGPPNWMDGKSVYSVSTTSTEKAWFSGSFRYYMPDVGTSQWNNRTRLALFGVTPTPSLMWELMPYSWLIDWYTNVGDVISNFSGNAVDNLLCNYSYVMRSYTSKTTYSVHTNWEGVDTHPDIPGGIGAKWPRGDCSFSTISELSIKSRASGGSPFGLGLKSGGLTTPQLGILAALGTSQVG